jgi:alkaline phosphatase D
VKTPDLKRRTIVKGIAASSLLPLLGGNLIACSDGSDLRFESIPATFEHGIASGDPLPDRVIIWTRVTTEREGRVLVSWQVASDPGFTDIINQGSGETHAGVDYTVKVDVEGLSPGLAYYYRFVTGDRTSATGTLRTLPVDALAAATFAVISCSNYPAGFFNVYRELAGQELDAVLHLGDYLYEYAADGYASDRAEEYGRVVEPPDEILTLADYRTRYAQYHRDPDLQAAHAAHPFIIVWDDHEVANDAWREGAENHDPESEGEYSARRAAALQAWHEWLPVRPPATELDIIYRRFQYGDLLDLMMLDTRHVGRDRPYTLAEFAPGGIIDVAGARAAFADGSRTLLGAEQLAWLRESLAESSSRWQVLGQQVLMGRYPLPAPILESLDPGIGGDFNAGVAALLASVAAKNKPPEERSAEEQALLDSAIPYNPDAWDGYAFERDSLLEYARQLQSRLVVLAGDTHNAWATQLTTADGEVAGVELAAASVSSPGLEALLGTDAAVQFAPLLRTLVDDLRYVNLVQRGYLLLTFTHTSVDAEWRFVSTIESTDYTVDATLAHKTTVSVDDLELT